MWEGGERFPVAKRPPFPAPETAKLEASGFGKARHSMGRGQTHQLYRTLAACRRHDMREEGCPDSGQ